MESSVIQDISLGDALAVYMLAQTEIIYLKMQIIKDSKFSQHIEKTDDVHDLRTSSRRCLSIIQGLNSFVESQTAEFMTESFKKILRKTGKLRDYDVMISFLSKTELNAEDCEIQKTECQELCDYLNIKREKSWQELSDFINSDNFSISMRELRLIISSPEAARRISCSLSPGKSEYKMNNIAPAVLFRAAADINAFSQLKQADLHRLRIACKKMRYLTEFFSFYSENKKSFLIDKIKKLQSELGIWHDIYFLKSTLKKLNNRTGKYSNLCKSVDVLEQQLQKKMTDQLAAADLSKLNNQIVTWLQL